MDLKLFFLLFSVKTIVTQIPPLYLLFGNTQNQIKNWPHLWEQRENKKARDQRWSFPEKYWTFDSLLFMNQYPSRQFWKPKIRFWSLSNLKGALWLLDLISSRAFRWIREKGFVLWRIWGWAKAHVDWFVPLVFYQKVCCQNLLCFGSVFKIPYYTQDREDFDNKPFDPEEWS